MQHRKTEGSAAVAYKRKVNDVIWQQREKKQKDANVVILREEPRIYENTRKQKVGLCSQRPDEPIALPDSQRE